MSRSRGPEHALQLARTAVREGSRIVVAAGGDGTANEVLNGILQAQDRWDIRAALGVIGIGRGNDFAHTIGAPQDLREAVELIRSGIRRPIDVGLVRGGRYPLGRYFGNCVGIGFDAIGTIEAAKLPRLGGFLSFLFAVLKTIILYHRAPVSTVTFDGRVITQASLMISVMNGRRLGGGFWMAPLAHPDDRFFDLCVVQQVNRLEILRLVPRFMKGTQASHPAIQTETVRQVTVEVQQGALSAQADGEILCIEGQRLEIELQPRRVEVLSPIPGEGG